MNFRKSTIAFSLALALGAGLCPVPTSAQVSPESEADPTHSEIPQGSVSGMGDINLYPRRVIIQGRQRTAQVGLFNRTANDGDYEINITEMAMTLEGRLVALDAADPDHAARVKSAKAMIRWSPKRLSLSGSESQTIRLMARPAADTPPGEYRAHFVAISRPEVSAGGVSIDEAVSGQQADGIGVTIRPRFGISIPVIVRVGETTLRVGLEDLELLKLPDGRQALKLTMTREGTRSAYGDLRVLRKGSDDPVAIIRGVGIYPEIDQRTVVVPLAIDSEGGAISPGEELTVIFIDDDFDPGSTLAEAQFSAP